MEKLKSLIVEDVRDTSDYTLQRIKKLCPVIASTDQAFTLDESYKLIKENKYDIVFLDIQMPKGTGFDLLKRLEEEAAINFEIIFITGESAKEHTLRAIKYSALDFLYKPLDDGELVMAVNKAIEKLQKQDYNRQIKLLLDRIDSSNEPKSNKIAFHLHNGIIEFVDIQQIIYIQADGVISYVYLYTGEKLTTTKNLGFYKEMLILDYGFLAISNSTLVNREYIKRYNYHELLIVLTNGTRLYASKRLGKELKDSLSSQNFPAINSILKFFKK